MHACMLPHMPHACPPPTPLSTQLPPQVAQAGTHTLADGRHTKKQADASPARFCRLYGALTFCRGACPAACPEPLRGFARSRCLARPRAWPPPPQHPRARRLASGLHTATSRPWARTLGRGQQTRLCCCHQCTHADATDAGAHAYGFQHPPALQARQGQAAVQKHGSRTCCVSAAGRRLGKCDVWLQRCCWRVCSAQQYERPSCHMVQTCLRHAHACMHINRRADASARLCLCLRSLHTCVHALH